MAKNKIMEATGKIVAILDSFNSEERVRVIQAALTVLGEDPFPGSVASGSDGDARPRQVAGLENGAGAVSAKTYFKSKEPKFKGEELATAARYREQHTEAEASTKNDLKAVFKDARRNFDANNFLKDLNNARTKGLFNKGTGKDSAVLSHYGQNYVDAMPDRDAMKKLRKPKRASAPRKKASKKTRRT